MGSATNYPFGISSQGVPTIGSGPLPLTTGNYWFVNSATGIDGNSGSANQPLKTTARAIVLASAGDIIVWEPGHAETIAAAGGITVNKAGLTFWGLGEGKNAATFTSATSTAATFLISSANTVIGGNVNTVCNIASQVTFFSVTAANVTLGSLINPITHYDTSATVGAITWLTASAAAAQPAIFVDYNGFTASTIGTAMISLVGVVNANIWVDAYGAWSTAVVNFITTACTNITIAGLFYNYNTSLTKDVVDTITGSTWTVQGYDGIGGYNFDGGSGKTPANNDPSVVVTDMAVPTANSTANVLMRDVIGNKTDTAVNAFGTTSSLAAYVGGLLNTMGAPTATEVFTPGSASSIIAYLKGIIDTADRCAVSSVTGVLTTGTTIFTIAGGPIELLYIMSMCTTGGDSTAATLLYTTTPTGLSAVPISTASGSVANAPVNATVTYAGTGSAAACSYNAGGTFLLASTVAGSGVIIPPGTIKITVGSGPTVTGTWSHYIKYRAMGPGITCS